MDRVVRASGFERADRAGHAVRAIRHRRPGLHGRARRGAAAAGPHLRRIATGPVGAGAGPADAEPQRLLPRRAA
jgi:hypothetical protein